MKSYQCTTFHKVAILAQKSESLIYQCRTFHLSNGKKFSLFLTKYSTLFCLVGYKNKEPLIIFLNNKFLIRSLHSETIFEPVLVLKSE